ncbi:hypothetical protein LZ30DRAFT_722793, partial [Colletotrichum cereale]
MFIQAATYLDQSASPLPHLLVHTSLIALEKALHPPERRHLHRGTTRPLFSDSWKPVAYARTRGEVRISILGFAASPRNGLKSVPDAAAVCMAGSNSVDGWNARFPDGCPHCTVLCRPQWLHKGLPHHGTELVHYGANQGRQEHLKRFEPRQVKGKKIKQIASSCRPICRSDMPGLSRMTIRLDRTNNNLPWLNYQDGGRVTEGAAPGCTPMHLVFNLFLSLMTHSGN